MKVSEIESLLLKHKNPKNVAGMARFGISSTNTLGISIGMLRSIAKDIQKVETDIIKRHEISLALWKSGFHEAKILASLIDDPLFVTKEQMEKWVKDFDSWDVCDQVCSNLFDKTIFAFDKAKEWSLREEEFVKRAGYVLMATLSVHSKKTDDAIFLQFFPHIMRGSTDERNFVKKAVNWALRQIGKRNDLLRKEAIELAEEILKIDTPSARWIAHDALRELNTRSITSH